MIFQLRCCAFDVKLYGRLVGKQTGYQKDNIQCNDTPFKFIPQTHKKREKDLGKMLFGSCYIGYIRDSFSRCVDVFDCFVDLEKWNCLEMFVPCMWAAKSILNVIKFLIKFHWHRLYPQIHLIRVHEISDLRIYCDVTIESIGNVYSTTCILTL